MANQREPAPAGTLPDLEQFSLRRFLESLPPDQKETRDGRIELGDIAAVLDGNPRAVLFNQPGDCGLPLCGNVAGSRARLAHAFGATPETVTSVILQRLRKQGILVEVDRSQAPVQQIVQVGEECDLTALPVHLQHALDGAPYISASLDFSRDPATGWTNVGMRRLMLRGRRTDGRGQVHHE